MMIVPQNIFEYRDKETPLKNGGTMIAKLSQTAKGGLGWYVYSKRPNEASGEPDTRVEVENADVWLACRVMNDILDACGGEDKSLALRFRVFCDGDPGAGIYDWSGVVTVHFEDGAILLDDHRDVAVESLTQALKDTFDTPSVELIKESE